MKKITLLHFAVLILFLVAFQNISSAREIANASKNSCDNPAWAQDIPADKNFKYFVGIGESSKLAKDDALSEFIQFRRKTPFFRVGI